MTKHCYMDQINVYKRIFISSVLPFQSSLRCVRMCQVAGRQVRCLASEACTEPPDVPLHTPEHVVEPPLPDFVERTGETSALKKARLVYQSRKRGMLENGILLRFV